MPICSLLNVPYNHHNNAPSPFLSVSVVRRLTMSTTVAPGDVLVLAQEVEPPNVNDVSIQCANVIMRVLGETRE